MARERIGTTVDRELLDAARSLQTWPNDASLFDAALGALLAAYRPAETDLAYRLYDERPLNEADEWGDLESFRAADGSA